MSDETGELPVDIAGQLDAVERGLTIEQKEEVARVQSSLSQVYATTVDDLWDACTNAERLPRWFAPVTGDLKLGGRYQVEGNAGGTVESCEPPRHFAATWEFGGAVSRIEVSVEAVTGAEEGARLTLVHRADTPNDFWATYGPGATGVGWELGLLGLALHISAGASKPPESSGWETSPQAREFVAGSSHQWARASVDAGTPEEDARAAELRTTAFYRGEEH